MAKKRTSIKESDMCLDVLNFDLFLERDLSDADRNIMVGIFLLQYLDGGETNKTCYPCNAGKNACGFDLPSLYRRLGLTCTAEDIEKSISKLERLWYLDVYGSYSRQNGRKAFSRLSELKVKFRKIDEVIYWDGVQRDCTRIIASLVQFVQKKNEKIARKAAREAAREAAMEEKQRKFEKWIEEKRAELIKNATKSELKVQNMFDVSHIPYIFQKPFVTEQENIYFVDFYLPQLKIAIEVDGGYHTAKEQRRKDLERTMEIEEDFGVRIYRIDNRDTSDNKLLKHCLEDILYRRQNELGIAI